MVRERMEVVMLSVCITTSAVKCYFEVEFDYPPVTGCIRPGTLDRLNPGDAGGQYDSSGGAGGQGNPQGSACIGYNHYVELVEPSDSRACIKCCDDPVDCPTNMDTSGCPAVIPGNYFNCG
jgi:hypothetical protein